MPIYNSSLLFRLPLTPSRSLTLSLSSIHCTTYFTSLSLSFSAKPLINCHWLKRQKQSALLMLWLRLLQRVGNTFFGVVVIVANSLLIICRIISFFVGRYSTFHYILIKMSPGRDGHKDRLAGSVSGGYDTFIMQNIATNYL